MPRGPQFKPSAKDKNPVQAWYDKLEKGRFGGNAPLCQWIGPDLWLFHPDPNFPFYFERANGERITPGEFRGKMVSFDTDGGSIPDFARGLPDMSRWHFGGAYLIHDWEWHLHSQGWPVRPFEETNLVLCEAIKTLLEDGYISHDNFTGDAGTVRNIYRGVQSPFARRKWEEHSKAKRTLLEDA